MFRSRPACILFKFDFNARHPIHSFFVGFPFDAVYLDENQRVVDVFERVPSFVPALAPRAPAKFLLELPAGRVRKHKISIGDKFAF